MLGYLSWPGQQPASFLFTPYAFIAVSSRGSLGAALENGTMRRLCLLESWARRAATGLGGRAEPRWLCQGGPPQPALHTRLRGHASVMRASGSATILLGTRPISVLSGPHVPSWRPRQHPRAREWLAMQARPRRDQRRTVRASERHRSRIRGLRRARFGAASLISRRMRDVGSHSDRGYIRTRDHRER
jgi:hypothetical protein